MGKVIVRITRRLLESTRANGDLWDSDIAGFHARIGTRATTFRIAYKTMAGKRRVLSLGRYGVLSVEEARQAAKEVLATVIQGHDPRQIEHEARQEAKEVFTTLGEYLNGPYTVYQNRRKDGRGTLNRIRNDFSTWLSLPMVELSSVRVETWQANEEAKAKPRVYSSLKRSYGALLALLNHAVNRQVIPHNPLKGIKLQKPALKEDDFISCAVRRYLEDAEVTALFFGLDRYQDKRRQERRSSRAHGKPYLPCLDDVAYVDHVKPFVLTMFYTGFRPGDLFGLCWEHVNLQFKTIRKVIEKTAHHNPQPQTFPLSSMVLQVLTTWHQQLGKPSMGYVFTSPVTGGRLASTAMRKPWNTIRALGGLAPHLALYTLRHNFASQLVMAGVDLLTVSRLMGHSNIETTIKHYAHMKPDHQRDAVEKMGESEELRKAV